MSACTPPLISITIWSLLYVHPEITVFGSAITYPVTPTILTPKNLNMNQKRIQDAYATQTFKRQPSGKNKQFEYTMNQNGIENEKNDPNASNDTFVVPENNYKCPPCVCTDRSKGVLGASCKGVNISQVPQNLTIHIETLTITECYLRAIDLKQLKVYTNIKSAVISNNTMLTRITRSSGVDTISTVLALFLNRNQIEIIDRYSFTDMAGLQTLLLSENRLHNLTNDMFSGLTSLRTLDVSRNQIYFVHNQTFDDLKSLLILDISGNLLQINNQLLLPSRAFLNISQLEELYIQGNCEIDLWSCRFPKLVIQQLERLRVLSIDVHSENGIGPEGTQLLNLQSLIIDSNSFCSTRLINETFFEQTPNLVSLTIQNCPLVSVEPKAYSKLLHLHNLTVKSVPPDYNLCFALSDIHGFQNASLKHISLSGVNKYDCACRKLNAAQGQYLKQHNLIELDLSWNNIIAIYPGFSAQLPTSLKRLDLSGNDLSAGVLYRPLTFPVELAELILNYETYQYASQCSEENIERDATSQIVIDSAFNEVESYEKQHVYKHSYISNMSKHSTGFNNMEDQAQNEIFQFVNPLYFHFPINVKIWNAILFPQFGVLVLKRVYEQNSSLTEINFSGGFFTTWGTSHLLSKIRKADLSNNFCRDMTTKFIPKNNSLEYFSISNNYLGNVFSNDSEGLIFAKAKRLRFLDISRNLINGLPRKFFKGLVKLHTLKATDNKIQMINSSFAHLKDLALIDMSRNSITWMSRSTRDDLDLVALHHTVYLDLSSNPLPCTCAGIEMMQWMATTNVFLLNRDFLVCVNETNEIEEIGDIFTRVQNLKRHCSSKSALIASCVFAVSSFTIVLTASMMYRYRWWLKYFLNASLARFFGKKSADNTKFQFDAYILYTDETRMFVLRDCVQELEKSRGHRICIEERDFLPGTYMASYIFSSVQNSAMTVAMVTPEFYEDDFSEYRVKMALMEERYSKRNLLYVCMCEPTRHEVLSQDLITVMKNNRFIERPPLSGASQYVVKEYWDRFSLAIGRTQVEGQSLVTEPQ